MKTVKLYKVTCTKAYMMSEQGCGYSLIPWGSDTSYYEGYDDGGKEYALPDGYKIGESDAGDLAIYDADNKHCDIVTHKSGFPQIVGLSDDCPVLRLA